MEQSIISWALDKYYHWRWIRYLHFFLVVSAWKFDFKSTLIIIFFKPKSYILLEDEDNEDEGCPVGWSQYKTSCFRIFDSKLTWTQAQSACQFENANLASIPNKGTDKFIGRLTRNHARVWLGGYQPSGSPTASNWKWVDQSPWSFQNWLFLEPNDWGDREDCLELCPIKRWRDIRCGTQLP